jgi:hypothetical protein
MQCIQMQKDAHSDGSKRSLRTHMPEKSQFRPRMCDLEGRRHKRIMNCLQHAHTHTVQGLPLRASILPPCLVDPAVPARFEPYRAVNGRIKKKGTGGEGTAEGVDLDGLREKAIGSVQKSRTPLWSGKIEGERPDSEDRGKHRAMTSRAPPSRWAATKLNRVRPHR